MNVISQTNLKWENDNCLKISDLYYYLQHLHLLLAFQDAFSLPCSQVTKRSTNVTDSNNRLPFVFGVIIYLIASVSFILIEVIIKRKTKINRSYYFYQNCWSKFILSKICIESILEISIESIWPQTNTNKLNPLI